MRQKAIPFLACALAAGASLSACGGGGSAGDEQPGSSGGPAAGEDGGDGSLPGSGPRDDSGVTEGGHPADGSAEGGDGSVPAPPGPIVGTVSSFAKALSSVVLDIACTKTDCYFAENGLQKLVNGATTASPLPAFPFSAYGITSVATVGTQVFTHALYNVGTTDFTSQVVVLNGGTWSSIGVARKTGPVGASLFVDGKNVYAGVFSGVSGGGVAMIAQTAGPAVVWTTVPGGMTSTGRFPVVDAQGALWTLFGQQTYRMRSGETSWTAVGAPWPAGGSLGRALVRAANGDLWYAGTSFVGKLPVGATAWTAISLPAGTATGKTSAVVVDGSNNAYLGIGEPHKLLKVPSGSVTAVDTGVVIATGRYCGAAAIDGAGNLLFSCYASDVAGGSGVTGVYRSTP